MAKIGEILPIDTREEAASFIPIDQMELRNVPFHEPAVDDKGKQYFRLRLSPRQSDIFELTGQGYTVKQIGHKLEISTSTVRTHKIAIVAALGLEPGRESSVTLRRIAGAKRSAEIHYEMIADQAAELQTAVSTRVQAYGQYASDHGVDPGAVAVKKVQNSALLNDLEENGFIPEGSARYGYVDMKGLIAALLFRHEQYGRIMTSEATCFVAKEIIKQEVDYYLTQQTASNAVAVAA